MKRLLYFFILVLLNTLTYSQSGWITQLGGFGSYYPYYPYSRDIFFLNSQTGWLLFPSLVKHTTNDGTNWRDYSIEFSGVTPFNIFFIDERTGWIAGRRIIKTVNSGLSWSFCDTTVNVRSIYFINALTGWACGINGKLVRSTNGGLNWDSVQTGVHDNLNSVYFTNDQTGFVAADWGKILRTTNAGVNWILFYDNITYSFFQLIKFSDNNTGMAAGSGGNIFMTHNGGINWVRSYYLNYTNITDLTFHDNQNWYACGTNGEVYRTTNSGTGWFKTQSTGLHLNNFCIESAGQGKMWLAADSGTIYKSVNYAQSWDERFRLVLTNGNLLSVYFINQNTGYCCGDLGMILKTTNSGTNWQVIRKDTNYTLTSIIFINQFTGITAGGDIQNRNTILRTTNEGSSWTQIFSDTSGTINALFFINIQTGWCSGNKGILLKTTNYGLNWTRLPVLPLEGNAKDIEFINNNTGFVTKTYGGYGSTTDGGQTWSMVYNPSIANGSIHFINQNTGFISGYIQTNTVILKTTDSGINWNMFFINQVRSNSIFFINENKGWLAQNSKISFSSNGGQNWILQHYNSSVYFGKIFFINAYEGWACGSYGTIVHTSTGGIGINKTSSEIPVGFKLYQNYPNPFNPVTKIRFDLPPDSRLRLKSSGNDNVVLKVYDILGREIAALINQPLQPGTYEVDFDGTKFASGVYFYNIRAGEFMHSRKMVLIK